MSISKFYHYNIWIEEDDGTRIDPNNVLSEDVFQEGIYDIAQDGDKHYSTQFQFIRRNEYHGVLIRTKDDSGYFRLAEDGSFTSLSDATEDEGETGDLQFDYVDFGVIIGHSGIDLLVEVGFQTPGIGKIKQYLNDHIEESEDHEIIHETKIITDSEEKLNEILDVDLKSVDISLKKNPRDFEGLNLEESLESLVPDDYRLEFGVSLHKGKDKQKRSARSVLSGIFNRGEEDISDTITQIDLPRVMYSFNIVGFEEGDEDSEIEENLADVVLKEEIEMSPYGIFDSELGEDLCRRIRELDD